MIQFHTVFMRLKLPQINSNEKRSVNWDNVNKNVNAYKY